MTPSIADFIVNTIITGPLTIFILAITLGILGLVLTFVYRDKLDADSQSKSWPGVPGKVTSSRIEKRSSFSYGTRRRNTRYVPVIKYSYDVEGNSYQAERIGNGIYVGMTKNSVGHWAKRFPTGAAVSVYYNPADPNDAVLERTTNSNVAGFGVGIFIDAQSVFLFIVWLYRLVIRH